MFRFILLAVALLLGGCAPQYPVVANLNLQIMPQPPIFTDTSAFIQGQDARKNDEIIIYLMKDQMPIAVDNMSPPHILVTERLAGGLREQGLMFENSAPTRVYLEITELLVTVTKPKFLFSADARSRITLKVVNETSSLAKTYQRQATHESPKRPDTAKLENMLNEQLSEILSQILGDEDIRKAIMAKEAN